MADPYRDCRGSTSLGCPIEESLRFRLEQVGYSLVIGSILMEGGCAPSSGAYAVEDPLTARRPIAGSNAEPFCYSCGRVLVGARCADSHDMTPPSSDIGVGRLVTYRRGLRRRQAVVVGESGTDGQVETALLESKGRECSMPDPAPAGDSERLMSIPSPLFRLETLATEEAWAQVLADWLSVHRGELLATVGDRRQYALAAVAAGDVVRASSVGLSEAELAWLLMHAHLANGDPRRAYEWALSLAPGAFPDRASVLVAAIRQEPDLADDKRLAGLLDQLDPDAAGSQILQGIVGATRDQVIAGAAELEELTSVEVKRAVGVALEGNEEATLNVWTRVATGAELEPGDLERVYAEFPSIADDLIDSQRVDAGECEALESSYLRSRLCIGGVTDDELRDLGLFRELARRMYVRDDGVGLESLAAESEEARYFISLDTLRRGELPEDVPDDDVVKAVAASIRSQRAHPNALADPSAWVPLRDVISEEDASAHPERAAAWQLDRALHDVFTWDLDAAHERARGALQHAEDEAIRDEALNIIGFVLHQRGEDDRAVAALEKALEGDYSGNLQTNIGIIAAEMRPEVAAHHIARLASEAPTLDLQMAAVRRSFGIWASNVEVWEDRELTIPAELVSSMRSLAVAVIPYADYVPLLQLLYAADDEWLADKANTAHGPNAESAARRVYVAKACHDPSAYVEALAFESKKGNEESWFSDEKNSFVESLRALIFEDPGKAVGPASFAFAAIDEGLDLDDFDYVTLACGAGFSILGAISEEEGLPSDKVKDMIVTARRRADRLEPEQQEVVRPLVAMATNAYGIVLVKFHAAVHDSIVAGIRSLGYRLSGVPRYRIRWDEIANAMRPMASQARQSARELRSAVEVASDAELQGQMREVARGLESLATDMSNPKRMF